MTDENQFLTAMNSGIQTVIPPAVLDSPQIVYLDFDGAETSYFNRDLDIYLDNITVEKSGLSTSVVSCIVDKLNEEFGDDILFTTELPVDTEYSTVYVGNTDAFDKYGDFLGLAETIDVGNQMHNDNAFVFLNSSASYELIESVIAHETKHIVNGWEHSGDGWDKYASHNNETISAGVVKNNMVVTSKVYLYVYGTLNSATIKNGSVHVIVSSGGKVNSIDVKKGEVSVYKGATITGKVKVSDQMTFYGGTMSSATVSTGYYEDKYGYWPTYVEIGNGAVAKKTTLKGNMRVLGKTSITEIKSGGSLFLRGSAFDTVVSSGGILSTYDGAIFDTVVKSGGILSTYKGTIGGALTLENGAKCEIWYGTIDFTVAEQKDPSKALFNDFSRVYGGSDYTITVGSNQALGEYVLANNYDYDNRDFTIVDSDHHSIGDIKIGGILKTNKRTYILSNDNSQLSLNVLGPNAEIKKDIYISGEYDASKGYYLYNATVKSSGKLYVYDDAMVTNTYVEGKGDYWYDYAIGEMYVYAGSIANNTDLYGSMCLFGGIASNTIVQSSADLRVLDIGRAYDTRVYGEMVVAEDGNAYNTDVYGEMVVEEDGNAYNTDVYGEMVVCECGQAYNTSLDYGYMFVDAGGFAQNIYLCCDSYLRVGGEIAGTITFDADSYDDSSCYMLAGGTIDFTVLNQKDLSTPLINDFSRVEWENVPELTITVDENQAHGKYALADCVNSLDEILTVRDSNGDELGTISVGGTLETKCFDCSLYLSNGRLNLEISKGEVTFANSIGGKKTLVYKEDFNLKYTGKYSVSGSFGKLNATVTLYKGKTKVATGTVSNGKLTFNGKKDVLLDAGTNYSIEIKSSDKGKTSGKYSLTIMPELFYDRIDNTDDSYKASGLAKYDLENGMKDWVGYKDSIDYRKLTLDSAAKLSFNVKASDAAKFVIWQKDKNGKMKALQTTTLTANKKATTKSLLLESGKYYISMESTNAKSGGYADYSVNVNSGSVFFDKGYNGDDSWNGAGVAQFNTAETWSDWVGFGDSIDYKALTLDTAACLSFKVKAADAAKFVIWKQDKKTGKLKSVQSTTLKANKSTTTSALMVEAGNYFISMEATNAKKGASADYTVKTGSKYVTFPAATTNDDTLKKAKKLDAHVLGDVLDGWVGLGDLDDYFKINADHKCVLTLDLDEATAKAYSKKEVKLALYDADGKSIALTSSKVDAYDLKTKASISGDCYLAVTCANGSKYNTQYGIIVNAI